MFLPYVLICPPIMDGVDWTYNVSAYLEAFAFNRRGLNGTWLNGIPSA